MSERDSEFLPEEWTLYGIGVAILLLRFATRIKTVGIRNFQGDDYFSILTLGLFTVDAATVHIIYYTGTNVEASVVQQTRTLTPDEIRTYTFGSQEQLAAWYSYTALIWSMKATMLFFFNRLTVGLWQHRYVKWLGLLCGVSYMAVVLTITFGCFPTQKNWQVVPDPGLKCTLKMQNFLVTVVLNVITDALILCIPAPLLWKLKIPLQKKILISILLCSGLFVITAAIIRVVLTLGANPSALNINRWGVRETIVGIVTINLPILKPLFSKNFWSFKSFKSTSLSYGNTHNLDNSRSPYELATSTNSKAHTKSRNRSDEEDCEPVMGKEGKILNMMAMSEETLSRSPNSRTDSDEFILQGVNEGGGVKISTTLHYESEDIKNGPGTSDAWQKRGMGVSSKVTVAPR